MFAADAKLEMVFRPIINPLNEQVMIYRAIPILQTPDGVLTGAKQVLDHNDDPVNTALRNIAVLKLAASALEQAHAAGNGVLLMMPVSGKALETKESATLMVQALKSLPDVCNKAAISHLFDLPNRINTSTLDDIVIPLLITIDKFVIEPPASLEDYTVISACNAQGVVLDMEPGAGSGIALAKFWAAAAPRRLGMFVQNITDEDSIGLVQRYEGRGMDGQIFGDAMDNIGPRTSRSELASLTTS
ncbi:MAG: hypothetical protein COB46_00805 [Rhodospirillaceae bacterium]|nr:MAG: hypothetical protein COB46_00805 [Rhodospirillaceae bacterium]